MPPTLETLEAASGPSEGLRDPIPRADDVLLVAPVFDTAFAPALAPLVLRCVWEGRSRDAVGLAGVLAVLVVVVFVVVVVVVEPEIEDRRAAPPSTCALAVSAVMERLRAAAAEVGAALGEVGSAVMDLLRAEEASDAGAVVLAVVVDADDEGVVDMRGLEGVRRAEEGRAAVADTGLAAAAEAGRAAATEEGRRTGRGASVASRLFVVWLWLLGACAEAVARDAGVEGLRAALDGVRVALDGVRVALDGVRAALDGVRVAVDGARVRGACSARWSACGGGRRAGARSSVGAAYIDGDMRCARTAAAAGGRNDAAARVRVCVGGRGDRDAEAGVGASGRGCDAAARGGGVRC